MSFSHQTARLSPGRHANPEDGVCVMELASVLAGERFTDRPSSASPLLTDLLQGYNDGLDDARRQTLKRFAPAVLDTAGGAAAELERVEALRAFDGARPARWALLRRWYRTAAPYTFAFHTGRRIAAAGDDQLHAEMCGLFDALIAIGRPRERALDAAGARTRARRMSTPLPPATPGGTLGP